MVHGKSFPPFKINGRKREKKTNCHSNINDYDKGIHKLNYLFIYVFFFFFIRFLLLLLLVMAGTWLKS